MKRGWTIVTPSPGSGPRETVRVFDENFAERYGRWLRWHGLKWMNSLGSHYQPRCFDDREAFFQLANRRRCCCCYRFYMAECSWMRCAAVLFMWQPSFPINFNSSSSFIRFPHSFGYQIGKVDGPGREDGRQTGGMGSVTPPVGFDLYHHHRIRIRAGNEQKKKSRTNEGNAHIEVEWRPNTRIPSRYIVSCIKHHDGFTNTNKMKKEKKPFRTVQPLMISFI